MTDIDLYALVHYLSRPKQDPAAPHLPVALPDDLQPLDEITAARNLITAFLILLAGRRHAQFTQAESYIKKLSVLDEWKEWASFYRHAAKKVVSELTKQLSEDPELESAFNEAEKTLTENPHDTHAAREALWSAFFPEGTGISGQEKERTEALRKQRTVTIDRLNDHPVQSPGKEMLFTSNVLLTTPLPDADLSAFDRDFRDHVSCAQAEPQEYWYDHPIPVGQDADSNELLYGLTHFNEALTGEKKRGNYDGVPVAFALSISVTHTSLHKVAKQYLKQVIASGPSLDYLNVFAFTEADAEALIDQVLLPAAERCGFSTDVAKHLLSVFGVDGRYGRHYSFLKAIAALWNVLIDDRIRATFKIDLDQVFPQKELIEETGRSAFEHFRTPLWGASGFDSQGAPIELGMIAGALVNQHDIGCGLFTPDVAFPSHALTAETSIFFSKLPQALSTQAEMMTRYRPGTVLDGTAACLERIHVTGGTNGILVDSLRRFQPFTPSFVGRAEDQAYVLSTFSPDRRLGYVHAAGLIMRHDKEGFARTAIARAKVGTQISDYLRLLLFSEYAEALPLGTAAIKQKADPFTGCFISKLPLTVTLFRFALKAAALFHEENTGEALQFLRTGIPLLKKEIAFTQGNPSALKRKYLQEREGWDLFYRSLTALEKGLEKGGRWAQAAQKRANEIVKHCLVSRANPTTDSGR